MANPHNTLQVYDRDWQAYLRSDILAPESVFLEQLKGRWSTVRVMDLGFGAGRTTWVFSRLVDEYIGVELVPRMVEECRKLFGETAKRRFLQGDAANLQEFADASFDVVLFSFNGIDNVPAEKREQALREIHRVLKPQGSFFFSSHNLGVFPFYPIDTWKLPRNPFRWMGSLWNLWKETHFYRRVNALALSPDAQREGWALLPDKAHQQDLEIVYILPRRQVADLEAAGFSVQQVLDYQGHRLVDPARIGADWIYHYQCTKR